jgi:hypothetical protein
MSTPKTTQAAPFDREPANCTDAECPPQVDSAAQGAIGRKLREAYEEVVREEVPERLLQLLDQLKKKEQDQNRDGA